MLGSNLFDYITNSITNLVPRVLPLRYFSVSLFLKFSTFYESAKKPWYRPVINNQNLGIFNLCENSHSFNFANQNIATTLQKPVVLKHEIK